MDVNSLDFLLNDIKTPVFDENLDLLSKPFQAGSLKYVGYGNKLPDEKEFEPDVLRFDNTLPTMMLEPVRNMITGEIESYRDVPIATLASDDTSINRPISSIDDYHRGAPTGVAFTPGGIAQKAIADPSELPQFILALETGTNLLATPLSKETNENKEEPLPQLPDSQQLKPTEAPKAAQQQITNQIKRYAVADTWDWKEFANEIPNPALTFPFPLDPFQLRAMHRLELGEAVFVSAPTSAGKTAIAQYAIALCRSHKMRTLYTSPIKALSNQKFRDLQKQFGDVGILTGDISINREASCLIMTTEILRSMLYHGADLLRDVECVIFDECHFIANDERGVVWEEAIILLPFHINMVFLSATVPNALEIADWIGRTKQRMIYVQEQRYRPVPLEHVLYTGDCQFYYAQKPGCAINQGEIFAAKTSILQGTTHSIYSSTFWTGFLVTAIEFQLMPILIFCFSQRMCEELAETVHLSEPLLSPQEQHHVKGFCKLALSRLNRDDRDLPQITKVLGLLQRGIGIHHGGMLPILKEIVEILLSEGFIKILFCTSTFAMGINVPARSCAFVSLDKYNGKEMAKLTPTEYVQMSGRAGRRGLDTVGTSIILCFNDVPDMNYLVQLFQGNVEPLQSQFKLKFNTILNLLRVRDIQMIDLLRRSLSANLIQSMMPKLVKELEEANKALKNLQPIECTVPDIEDIPMNSFGENLDLMWDNAQWLFEQFDIHSIKKQFIKGRVVFVMNEKPSLVAIREVVNEEKIIGIDRMGEKVIFAPTDIGVIFPKPTKSQERMTDEDCRRMLSDYKENPLNWTKILATSDFDFAEVSGKLLENYNSLRKSPCFNCPLLKQHLDIYTKKRDLLEKKNDCETKMHDESLAFKPLLDAHIDVLRFLDFITDDNVLLLKGRVSIEINSINEILATELLVSKIFDDITPEECASIVSVMCCDGVFGSGDVILYPQNIPSILQRVTEKANYLEDLMCQFGILTADDFVERNVNPILCQTVFDWASCLSFKQIMEYTPVAEGIVVRVINRVGESLRDLSNAAKLIGCMSLSEKFSTAEELIKRDIIFASSLYFE